MEYLIIAGFLVMIAFMAFIYIQLQNKKSDNGNIQQRLDALNQNMTENLNSVTQNVLQQLNNVTTQVNERLKESTQSIERQQRSVGERLDTAAKVVNTVNSRLSKI